MDDKFFDLCGKLIPPKYAAQAKEARNSVQKQIQQLVEQRTIPDEGWNAQTIEILLNNLSLMDSNNFSRKLTDYSDWSIIVDVS